VKNPELLPLWQCLKQMLQKYEPFMRMNIDAGVILSSLHTNSKIIHRSRYSKKHVGIYSMPLFENPSLIGKLSERIIGKKFIGFRTDDDPL
jgi:hypothetical protein